MLLSIILRLRFFTLIRLFLPFLPKKYFMYSGVVRRWATGNEKQGYGFITGDDGADNFVHHSDLNGHTLLVGKRVRYDLATVEGKGGKTKTKAVNIRGGAHIREPWLDT